MVKRRERKYLRGSMGWSECHSQATNPATRATPPTSAAITSGDDHPWAGPSMMPRECRQAADRQQGTGRIGAPGICAPRLGDQQQGPHQAGGDHRDVDQEHRPPPEVGQEQPARDWPDGDSEPDRPRPHADRPCPLGGVAEDVVDDREARRDGHGGPGPHERPPRDEGSTLPEKRRRASRSRRRSARRRRVACARSGRPGCRPRAAGPRTPSSRRRRSTAAGRCGPQLLHQGGQATFRMVLSRLTISTATHSTASGAHGLRPPDRWGGVSHLGTGLGGCGG